MTRPFRFVCDFCSNLVTFVLPYNINAAKNNKF